MKRHGARPRDFPRHYQTLASAGDSGYKAASWRRPSRPRRRDPLRTVRGPNSLWRERLPKLKTKSGAKKRFRLTAKGKVRMKQSGKRHGMIKRTNKQIRNQRGTAVMPESDARIVRKFIPYA